jgi:PAS domain S-box-containing protein
MNARKRMGDLIIDNKELASVLINALKEPVIQYKEKEKHPEELVLMNKELAEELVITHRELALQIEENEKQAAELIIGNQEKEKRIAALIIANNEIEKRSAELLIANEEKGKQASELYLANQEKEKRAEELLLAIIQNEENKELRNAYHYARSLLEASLDPLVTIDFDGRITDVNSATENATGLLRNSLIGTDFSDYFTEPDKARIGYRKVFEQGYVRDYPLTIRHFSGSLMDVLYNASVYRSEDGEILGVFATARDITKAREAEEKLKKKMEESDLLNKALIIQKEEKIRLAEALTIVNSELSQFAYVASHELKEPLRTISNFVQIFEEDYLELLDENGLRYLQILNDSTKRMTILLSSLLDFSLLGHNIKQTNVDCKKLLDDVIANLGTLILMSNAAIEVTEMPRLNLYESEVRQLFQHLIVNAIKFQKKGAKPRIQIRSEKIHEKWRFSVCDNGIGIDPAHFERIFGIFQRLHNNENEYGGSGIGLAFCKKIVQLHQGEIWVESNEEDGVTFHFTVSNLAE